LQNSTAISDQIETAYCTELSGQDKRLLDCSFERVSFRRKSFLIKEGEKEEYLYFVEKGLLRYWVADAELNEITFWFTLEKEFGNSYLSLIHHTPSEFNIQALEHCDCWRIHKSDLYHLFETSLQINRIARSILEEIFTRKIKRETFLLKLKPKERYTQLLRDKRLIENVPLRYLASYLGVTPETLSRIRAKILI